MGSAAVLAAALPVGGCSGTSVSTTSTGTTLSCQGNPG